MYETLRINSVYQIHQKGRKKDHFGIINAKRMENSPKFIKSLRFEMAWPRNLVVGEIYAFGICED